MVIATTNTLTICMVWFMESVAQFWIGQTIFRMVDRFLWIIEKSTQWSVPPQELAAEENGKTFRGTGLVRPLPWILFLTVLLMLRMLRLGLDTGRFIFRYRKIEPGDMVKYIQTLRKRLRAIKNNGMKSLRQRRVYTKDCDSNLSGDTWKLTQMLKTIQLTLSSLSCLEVSKINSSPPPMRIKIHINQESTRTPEERSTTESAVSPLHGDSKRKYTESSSENNSSEDSDKETIMEKIDRLAAPNEILDDDDFYPAELSSQDDDTSISSDSHISEAEIQQLRAEANLVLHRAMAGVNEVIQEESEPTKPISVPTRMVDDEKYVNSKSDCCPGNGDDFYNPNKLGGDEMAFYSPISSTSPSPDRMAPNFRGEQSQQFIKNETRTTNSALNDEEKENKSTLQSPSSPDKTANGVGDKERVASPSKSSNKLSSKLSVSRGHVSRKKPDGASSSRPMMKKKK